MLFERSDHQVEAVQCRAGPHVTVCSRPARVFAGAMRLLWQPGKSLSLSLGCSRTGRVMHSDGGRRCQRRDGCSDCRAIIFPELAGPVSALCACVLRGCFCK